MMNLERQKRAISKELSKKVKAGIAIAVGVPVAAVGIGVGLGETHNLPEEAQTAYDNTRVKGIEIIKEKLGMKSPEIAVEVPGEGTVVSSPGKPSQETPPPVIEETTKETPEEEIKEFTSEMIKNRLYLYAEELLMWYIEEWSDDEVVVSAVVAGPLEFDQGESKEIKVPLVFIPVVFQNPVTGTFLPANLTIADPEMGGTIPIVELIAWHYLPGEGGNYLAHMITPKELLRRLRVGDQIAFSLFTSLKPVGGESPPDCDQDYDWQRFCEHLSNGILVVEAMKQNKDFPEVTIFPLMFFINKE